MKVEGRQRIGGGPLEGSDTDLATLVEWLSERYNQVARRLIFKWLNRRSQKASFTWETFQIYLEHYPLPKPRIAHRLYTLSPDS